MDRPMRRIKLLFFLVITSTLILGCRRPGEQAQQQPKPPVPPANAGRIEAKLTYLEGEVSLTRDKTRLPAELDMVLLPGDTVETGKDAQAEVTFDDSSAINLDPESRFVITELVKDSASGQRTGKTNLFSGELKAQIAKLAQNSTFEIESPTAVAAVRGTEFIVAYREGQPTQVTVLVGRVGVRRPGKREAEVFIQEHERLFIRLAERPGRPFRLAPGDEDLIRVKWKRWQERRIKVMERLRPRRAIFGPEFPRGMRPGMERGRGKPLLKRGAVPPRRGAIRKPAPRKPGALKRGASRTPKSKNPPGRKPGVRKSRRSR
jgi:hypothetical protein